MKRKKTKVRKLNLRCKFKELFDAVTIMGNIINNATLATYKDIVCKVNYISETGSSISSVNFTIYNYVSPNDITEFEQKVYPPSGTSTFRFEIVNSSF